MVVDLQKKPCIESMHPSFVVIRKKGVDFLPRAETRGFQSEDFDETLVDIDSRANVDLVRLF